MPTGLCSEPVGRLQWPVRSRPAQLGQGARACAACAGHADLVCSDKLRVPTYSTSHEVAAQAGYAEPHHLARMFRRACGGSPTQYRRERST